MLLLETSAIRLGLPVKLLPRLPKRAKSKLLLPRLPKRAKSKLPGLVSRFPRMDLMLSLTARPPLLKAQDLMQQVLSLLLFLKRKVLLLRTLFLRRKVLLLRRPRLALMLPSQKVLKLPSPRALRLPSQRVLMMLPNSRALRLPSQKVLKLPSPMRSPPSQRALIPLEAIYPMAHLERTLLARTQTALKPQRKPALVRLKIHRTQMLMKRSPLSQSLKVTSLLTERILLSQIPMRRLIKVRRIIIKVMKRSPLNRNLMKTKVRRSPLLSHPLKVTNRT